MKAYRKMNKTRLNSINDDDDDDDDDDIFKSLPQTALMIDKTDVRIA
jgi:hypothetical protein